MAQKIQDQFTNLPLSRERKRQLRKQWKGLCVIPGCTEKMQRNQYCIRHFIDRREKARKYVGSVARYKNAGSYQYDKNEKTYDSTN